MASFPPARIVDMTNNMTGRITQVIRSRACGFIRAMDGQEVFFHASELEGVKLDELEHRHAVKFNLIRDSVSGPRAARVRIDRRLTPKAQPGA
jgi:cold shock CspA family protein